MKIGNSKDRCDSLSFLFDLYWGGSADGREKDEDRKGFTGK
jgi:hypothetical protein